MKNITLFLVEDDPLVSELLQEFLRELPPFQLIGEARDGATAVHEILRQRPDLLILDLRLPEMHGLDVLQIIHDRLPSCKVIIFTGSLSESILRKALQLGAVAFVEKAYGLRELKNALQASTRGESYFSPSIARLIERYPL
jgi:DNA-binding NarL/FixJ family response regulator